MSLAVSTSTTTTTEDKDTSTRPATVKPQEEIVGGSSLVRLENTNKSSVSETAIKYSSPTSHVPSGVVTIPSASQLNEQSNNMEEKALYVANASFPSIPEEILIMARAAPVEVVGSSSSSCTLDCDTTLSLSSSFSSPPSSLNHSNERLPHSLVTPNSMPNSSVPSDSSVPRESSLITSSLSNTIQMGSSFSIVSPPQAESCNMIPSTEPVLHQKESLLATQVHEEEEASKEDVFTPQVITLITDCTTSVKSNSKTANNYTFLEESLRRYSDTVTEDEDTLVKTMESGAESKINPNYFVKKKKKEVVKELNDIYDIIPNASSVPSWVSELRNAWNDEISNNMDESKKQYFLKFKDSDDESDEEEEEGDGPKKNTKIRRHMRQFIQEKEEDSSSKKYFLGNEQASTTPQKEKDTNKESPTLKIRGKISLPSESNQTDNLLSNSRLIESTTNNAFGSSTKNPQSTTSFIFRDNKKPPPNLPYLNTKPLLGDSKSQQLEPMSPTSPSRRPTFITNNSEMKHFQPRKENLFKKLFTTAPKKRTEADWRDELTKYEQRLSSYLKESRQMIKDLRKRQEMETEKMQQEYSFLQRCHESKLLNLYRDLSSCRLIRLKQRRELEKACKKVIKERIQTIREILVQQSQQLKQVEQSGDITMKCYNLLPHFVKQESYFKDVDELLNENDHLSRQWFEIELLEQLSKDLSEAYMQLRKESGLGRKTVPKKEVTQHLKTIIQRYIEEPALPICNFHLFCDNNHKNMDLEEQTWQACVNCLENDQRLDIEHEFFDLVCDQRTEEGQSLMTFLKEVTNIGLDKIPPSEIVDYISSFADYLSSRHGVSAELDRQVLLRLVSRLIYNEFKIGYQLHKIEIESHAEENLIFQQQSRILRKMSPNQLGVAYKYLPIKTKFTGKQNSIKEMLFKRNQTPFYDPIATLGYLNSCVTPLDMLHCVYSAARQIHIIAKDNCTQRGKEFSFGADEFFPILVYTVVHSHLPTIHSALSFLSKYSPNRNSEVVYYLTCLEGAVMYVQEITQDDIQDLTKDEDGKSYYFQECDQTVPFTPSPTSSSFTRPRKTSLISKDPSYQDTKSDPLGIPINNSVDQSRDYFGSSDSSITSTSETSSIS